MKNFILLIFFALTLLQSCTPKTNQLKADEIAKEVFTPTELKGIFAMIEFVDDMILLQKYLKNR